MKSKITIIIGVLALMVTSCGKDFLNVPSQTSLTTEVYFKTESDFVQAINGTYAPLRVMYSGTVLNGNPDGLSAFVLGEMHSDNTRYILNPSFRARIDMENAADFIHEPANTVSTANYQNAYQIIGRANQILNFIDGVTFTEATKNNVKGQALFLRAFGYYDLVQYFGSVPLHLTPVSSLGETALPLSTPEEIFGQIVKDAQLAITLLPEKSAQESGRATKGSAKILLANVYMIEKNYTAAETLLKEIVASGEYALLANYGAIYDPANKNNKESIFEIQYKQGTDGYSSSFIYQMFPYPLGADTLAKLTQVTDPNALTLGEGLNTPTPDLIEAYEAGDLRKDASIGYVHTSDGGFFPYVRKYLHPHTLRLNSNDDWPVYRYAEVLLFLAEALNEEAKPAEALPYLNLVRNRAGLTNVTETGQAALRDIILKERRVELAFENKRWFDLVRTGKAIEVITAYGARVKANPVKYYFQAGYLPVPAAFANILLTWPLPASESLLSPYF